MSLKSDYCGSKLNDFISWYRPVSVKYDDYRPFLWTDEDRIRYYGEEVYGQYYLDKGDNIINYKKIFWLVILCIALCSIIGYYTNELFGWFTLFYLLWKMYSNKNWWYI